MEHTSTKEPLFAEIKSRLYDFDAQSGNRYWTNVSTYGNREDGYDWKYNFAKWMEIYPGILIQSRHFQQVSQLSILSF